MNPSDAVSPTLLITRRDAILRVSALLGGVALVGQARLLAAHDTASPAPNGTAAQFTAGDIAFLDEIAETILPATKTPGAKAAKTGAFMARMVTDCYTPTEQKVFRDGLRSIDQAAKSAHGVSFMDATPPQRLALLDSLDHEQKRAMDARDATHHNAAAAAAMNDNAKEPAHYFRMMKELTLLGYFTSEVGCTQAMRYIETPGRFDPCIPYTAGETAWAGHA
jgi:Gluconate 2-dehydrogenase subunit 3